MRISCSRLLVTLAAVMAISFTLTAQVPSYAPSWTPPSEEDARAQLENLSFDEFMETAYEIHVLRTPQTVTRLGLAPLLGVRNDRLNDYSESYLLETQRIESLTLDLLHTYDRNSLSPEDQTSYDVLEFYWEGLVNAHPFLYNDYLVTQLYSASPDWVLFDTLANTHPLQTADDAVDFLACLSQVARQFDQLAAGLEARRHRGVIAPSRVLSSAISKIYGLATTPATSHPLFYAFALQIGGVSGLTTSEKQTMLTHALYFVTASVIPGYRRLYDELVKLEAEAPDEIGIEAQPGGSAYYEYLLSVYEESGRSPEELYDFGTQLVSLFQQALGNAFAQLGFPSGMSLADALGRAIEEAKSIYDSGIPIEYEHLVSEAKKSFVDAFRSIPQATVSVVSNPFYISFYRQEPLDGSRTAEFSVRSTGEEPKYMMPTIAYQQTYPGHHLQIATALETDLPLPRKLLLFPAHTNGWGAYAEQLAWELGAYDPENTTDDEYADYGNIGRLSQALNRAALMTVDLGVHAMDWTYDNALSYFELNTGIPASAAESALLQVLVQPGEATSAMSGFTKILELRTRTQEALGEQFDLAAFHDLIIGSGSLPLSVMERLVNEYLAETGGST